MRLAILSRASLVTRQASERARFLSVVSALERLADVQALGGDVDDFVASCINNLATVPHFSVSLRNSLEGRIRELRREIHSAGASPRVQGCSSGARRSRPYCGMLRVTRTDRIPRAKHFFPGVIDYDGMSTRYQSGRTLSPEAASTWSAIVAPFVQRAGFSRILDLGAGTSRFSTLFARSFEAHVIAIEQSSRVREANPVTRRHRPDAHFRFGIPRGTGCD